MTTSEPDKHNSNGHQSSPNEIKDTTLTNFGFEPLLDVAELTRMANQFMSDSLGARPAQSIDPARLPGASSLDTRTLSGDLAGVSEAELRNIPSTLGGFNGSVIPTVSPVAISNLPSSGEALANQDPLVNPLSMDLSTQNFDAGRAFAELPFGFLNDIRPMLRIPDSASLTPMPVTMPSASQALAMPGADQLSSYATTDLTTYAGTTASELSTPLLPGASQHTLAAIPGASQLESMRQLSRIDVIPIVEPFDASTAGALSNLGFTSTQPFDVAAIRRDFPILQQKVNGHDLIWLDNAATTQKPQSVIDRLTHFYEFENSNIHRAAHELAARSTDAYEAARENVRRFLNAPSVNEIIFVRGATEAINLVAQSWGRQNIQKDDEIVITWLEHHANIVPWQMLCAEKGARLRVAPVDDNGQILLSEYERLLSHRTKLVALTQVSNALGTVTPLEEMIEAAHRHGARVLVDGAQAVSHMRVDVQQYDCDFYVLSGHKLFAPTGIGVLFGKSEVLDAMQPWQGGGNMIQDVTFERTTYQKAPFRFEAGTGNIADAVGLGAAVEYLERIGMVNISRHENELLAYGTEALKSIPGLHMIGNAAHKAGILSFVLDGFRNEDVSSALNQQGIAVRAGHHCAQPILRRFGVEGTVRPSLALYNTCEDIDALIAALWNLKSGHTVGLIQ